MGILAAFADTNSWPGFEQAQMPASCAVFFWAYTRQIGGSKSVHFWNSEKFWIFKWFYLRSETVSEEKSQGKNDVFGALRAATTAGRREKQEEKFFDSRIVGPKAAERCFSSKIEVKTRRAERAQNFWVFFMRAKRACYQRVEKRFKKCALWGRKSRRKSVHFGEKKHWLGHVFLGVLTRWFFAVIWSIIL